MLELLSSCSLHTWTVGQPGAQLTVAGTQGAGVKTPAAAAVAAATAGLEGQEHMPKEGRLAIVPSIMVAAAMPHMVTVGWLVTVNGAGTAPKEQAHIAVWTTGFAIVGQKRHLLIEALLGIERHPLGGLPGQGAVLAAGQVPPGVVVLTVPAWRRQAPNGKAFVLLGSPL